VGRTAQTDLVVVVQRSHRHSACAGEVADCQPYGSFTSYEAPCNPHVA
jgi:hypothetical protein